MKSYSNFKNDEECQLISFYLARGHKLEDLEDMTADKYIIYNFSMILELENEQNRRGGVE